MQTNSAPSAKTFAEQLADIIDPPKTGVMQYRNDPAGFVKDCIKWKPGKEPTKYQLTNLNALVTERRVCVCGPHGLGKTTTNAWAILWFALTRDAEGVDWKVPTTASAWRQLTNFLWPEIHKWARQLNWDVIGRKPFGQYELLQQNLKLTYGEAFAIASDNPAAIEGVHADQVLYLYDEAKAIPASTFDATEGAFSGSGGDNDIEAFALASSTPGEPNGRFYEIQSRSPGFEDWHPIRVTLDDTIAAGRVTKEWADQRKLQWGEESAVYQNRVLGKFASSQEDGVIPLSWIEAANARWLALQDDGKLKAGPYEAVGVDVSRSGGDKTVMALRHGQVISEIRHTSHEDTMTTTGRVIAAVGDTEAMPIVDVLNMGAGVVDRLRELGKPVIAFNASKGSKRKDSTNEFGFVNCRADAWWRMRELLHPESLAEIALPPDDKLIGDLTAPTWRVMSGGKIQIESKDDIKKRLGRSTDDGDAVIQAFWEEQKVIWTLL